MNLRAKVALALAAIVLLIITIAGVGAGVGAADAVEDTVDRGLKRQIEDVRNQERDALRDVLEAGTDVSDRKKPCERSQGRNRDRNDAISRFVTADGKLIACEFDKVDITPAEASCSKRDPGRRRQRSCRSPDRWRTSDSYATPCSVRQRGGGSSVP